MSPACMTLGRAIEAALCQLTWGQARGAQGCVFPGATPRPLSGQSRSKAGPRLRVNPGDVSSEPQGNVG